MKTSPPISSPVSVSSSSGFEVAVLENPMPVLVAFWAPWCASCKAIAPVLDQLAVEFAGRALITQVNFDEESDIAGQYGIRYVPALILFMDGEPAERFTGDIAAGLLRHQIKSALSQSNN